MCSLSLYIYILVCGLELKLFLVRMGSHDHIQLGMASLLQDYSSSSETAVLQPCEMEDLVADLTLQELSQSPLRLLDPHELERLKQDLVQNPLRLLEPQELEHLKQELPAKAQQEAFNSNHVEEVPREEEEECLAALEDPYMDHGAGCVDKGSNEGAPTEHERFQALLPLFASITQEGKARKAKKVQRRSRSRGRAPPTNPEAHLQDSFPARDPDARPGQAETNLVGVKEEECVLSPATPPGTVPPGQLTDEEDTDGQRVADACLHIWHTVFLPHGLGRFFLPEEFSLMKLLESSNRDLSTFEVEGGPWLDMPLKHMPAASGPVLNPCELFQGIPSWRVLPKLLDDGRLIKSTHPQRHAGGGPGEAAFAATGHKAEWYATQHLANGLYIQCMVRLAAHWTKRLDSSKYGRAYRLEHPESVVLQSVLIRPSGPPTREYLAVKSPVKPVFPYRYKRVR